MLSNRNNSAVHCLILLTFLCWCLMDLGGGLIIKTGSGSRNDISGLQIEISATWYGVDVNRWPIGNHPSFMLYRLARSPLTQRDWKVKDCFDLIRSANSAQAQSLLLCPALSYSALSWETPQKSGGTVKKFIRRQAPQFVPPLLKCFRRHCV